MREVDLSVVTHAPDFALLQQLFASLAEPGREPLVRRLLVHDNSPDAGAAGRIGELARLEPGFDAVEVARGAGNVGFGRGHNANAARGAAPFILVVNQDCVLEPGALGALLDTAIASPADVAAWELRQIPYEHPKSYDPASLETGWVSGAAVLLRRSAFEQVGGFEPRIFMYGEDVDLSWRLRAKGWRLLYQPRIAVVHRTYRAAGEVKPLQVFGGVETNLCLRARYGGPLATLRGLAMLAAEIAAPQAFPGRRLGLARAGWRFLAAWRHFARTSVARTADFRPVFAGWGYELRREGAFVEMPSARERTRRERPRVSILVRTRDRPGRLREALASCANQTYPNLEVVVVEDGAERSRAVVEAFRGRLDVRYRSTQRHVGRARAGNIALAEARGEWLNFLDDDDVLFADHVELLVEAALGSGRAGAYGLAWETGIELRPGQAGYTERTHVTRYRQRFDRFTLWHHNYLPIQSVLFHRRLYERHGGFAEDMEQLEDWNLWTRYTLEDDFVLVAKTTSKYRVPVEARLAAERQARLDRAYADALERQRALRASFSPREMAEMAEHYARTQAVLLVTRDHLRRFVGRHRIAARAAAYRPFARQVLRRLGWRE